MPAGEVLPAPGCWLASLLMTVLSIVGDSVRVLDEARAGVKDSGGLLPGHGGVLDRIDGLSAALPLAALYFAYPPSVS